MSAPLPAGVSHLLIAEDALIPSHYCPECVTETARWNAEARAGRGGCPVSELAAVTDPDRMCPACRSGAAIRQTSCTPLVQAFSCDRCDTRWAISTPPALVDRIASAMAARSTPDEVITMAPEPRAPAAQDDDSQPRGYYIGECGHPVPWVGPICYVGPCDDCESNDT